MDDGASDHDDTGGYGNSTMQDLRLALRTLLQRPGFTLIAALTLALGVGATTAIFSVVNGVLLKPLPYSDPDRLVRVFHRNPQAALDQGFSREDWPEVRRAQLPFQELAGYFYMPGRLHENMVIGGQAVRLSISFVSGNLFRTMGVPPLLGGTITEEHDVPNAANYVVLSEGAWRAQFGAARDIAGRTVSIDGEPYTVLGVMPALFQFPARETQIWAPLALIDTTKVGPGRGFRWISAVGRLTAGESAAAARSALTPVLTRLAESYPDTNAEWTAASIVPLEETIVGEVRLALLVLLGAVGLVLLIACANLANLLLARASARGRELAVRSAVGAGRSRLARQLLVENLVLALAGGAIGVLLAVWMVDGLVSLGINRIPRPDEVGVNGVVLLFALGASLLSGALASVLPAWRAARTQPADALREGARGGTATARARARSLLVVAETSLAVLLLVGALLLTRSLWTLMRTDPGLDADQVIALSTTVPGQRFETPAELVAYRDRLLEHLRQVPGVRSAGASNKLPLTVGPGEPFVGFQVVQADGSTREFTPQGGSFYISTDYFRTLGTRILDGREFTDADRLTDESTVVPIVVNDVTARTYWPNQRAVGQYLRQEEGGTQLQVIGVVASVHMEGMAQAPQPWVYLPSQVGPRVATHVFIRPAGDATVLLDRLRAAVQQFDPEMPIGSLQPMSAVIGSDLALPRFYSLLLGLFAVTAVALAALGIYGIIAYGVSLRGHEIGVRLAMGAHRRDVVVMVVGQAMRITAIGLAIGLVAAYWGTSLMRGLLHGVSPRDPLAFAVVPLLLAAVALLAAALPALRAASTDPMVAFRTE